MPAAASGALLVLAFAVVGRQVVPLLGEAYLEAGLGVPFVEALAQPVAFAGVPFVGWLRLAFLWVTSFCFSTLIGVYFYQVIGMFHLLRSDIQGGLGLLNSNVCLHICGNFCQRGLHVSSNLEHAIV